MSEEQDGANSAEESQQSDSTVETGANQATKVADKSSKPSNINTHLAMTRTALSLDRTMLAWIRTSLALLGFGFTFAKYIHKILQHNTFSNLNIDSPRNLGIILMALGVGGMAGGIIQYFRAYRTLRKVSAVSPWTPAVVLAILIMVAGALLTIGILMKTKIF